MEAAPSPSPAGPREHKNRYEPHTIEKLEFSPSDHQWLTQPKFLSEHKTALLSAKKVWGMRSDGLHSYSTFDYFDANAFPPKADTAGGHVDFTTGIALEKIDSCVIVTPEKSPSNSDQFTFAVRQEPFTQLDLLFDHGFALLSNQGEMWQHFMQDTLHFLVFAQKFLQAHPHIPIFLTGRAEDSIFHVIKKELGLANPLVEFPPPGAPSRRYGVRSLYFCRFLPQSHLYSCAPRMRREVQARLCASSEKKNRLVYFSRKNQQSRRVRNEHEVLSLLERYACANDLEFVPWESGKYSLEETLALMRSTRLLVAPHGGANYHAYWMAQGASFVEFVLPQQLETLQSIACSIGLDYWLLPSPDANHHSQEFSVDVDALSEILEKILPSAIPRN